MSHTLTETSTYTSSLTVPDAGDSVTAASVNGAFQGLANRTKYLNDQRVTDEATIATRISVEDGNSICSMIASMPWHQTAKATSSTGSSSVVVAGDAWPSPTGYLSGWDSLAYMVEWDGSSALQFSEINQNGTGSPSSLHASSGWTAVEFCNICPFTLGSSRTSGIKAVAFINGNYGGGGNTGLRALVSGNNTPYMLNTDTAGKIIGSGHDPTYGVFVLSVNSSTAKAYVVSSTDGATWTTRVMDQTVDAAVPLNYLQFAGVHNCHSLGTLTNTTSPQYWWGRSTVSAKKLVQYNWNSGNHALYSFLSPAFTPDMTYVDCMSTYGTGNVSLGAGGDGTTLVVFDPLTFTTRMTFTPVEPYSQVIVLYMLGRYLVLLRGSYTHSWNVYDVTSNSAVIVANHIVPGGAIWKSVGGFGYHATLYGARYIPTAYGQGVGMVRDSRLNIVPGHGW